LMFMKRRYNIMRRLLATLFLISALALPGLVSTGVPSYAIEAAKPLIKCDTCGVVFTSQAGLEDHIKAHLTIKAAAATEAKPLIKCSTCGTVFTAGRSDRPCEGSPEHKAAAPLSNVPCGVEFTSIKETDEHLKTHPEHKVA
jgi:uncharacterized C2H2 Zn-finger protein